MIDSIVVTPLPDGDEFDIELIGESGVIIAIMDHKSKNPDTDVSGHSLSVVAGDAPDLEAAVAMSLFDAVAEALQPLRQFGPVNRPDGHFALEQAVIDHRTPFAVPALDHVRDDGMRVKLRSQVAGRVTAERRRDHLLVASTHHRSGRGVAHPGLDGVLRDPAQRRRHCPVVRLDDAFIAMRETDFGALSVTSRLGRWTLPSRRPRGGGGMSGFVPVHTGPICVCRR